MFHCKMSSQKDCVTDTCTACCVECVATHAASMRLINSDQVTNSIHCEKEPKAAGNFAPVYLRNATMFVRCSGELFSIGCCLFAWTGCLVKLMPTSTATVPLRHCATLRATRGVLASPRSSQAPKVTRCWNSFKSVAGEFRPTQTFSCISTTIHHHVRVRR